VTLLFGLLFGLRWWEYVLVGAGLGVGLGSSWGGVVGFSVCRYVRVVGFSVCRYVRVVVFFVHVGL
jgi:hypothetical protein